MTSRVRVPARGRAVFAVLLVGWALHRAAAQPATARARADALMAEGNAAFGRDDVATAAERYRAAWELAPEARVVLNLGIALAELGRNAAAAEAFAIYLADPASDPAKRPVIEQRLALWRPELGEIILEVAPASAVIEIDGARPLRTAAGTHVPVNAGRHLVTARAGGHVPDELRVDVAPGGRATAHLALRAEPARADATVPLARGDRGDGGERRERVDRVQPRPWKWIALGTGVAAAAAGGYFGVVALEGWRKVDDRCPGGVCATRDDLALADDARRAGTRANIAFGVSGVAVIAAALLWRFEPGRSSWLGGVSVAPRSSGGMLCVAGHL